MVALITVVICVVWLSIFLRSIGSSYATQRDYFKDKEKCFIDKEWKKVIDDLYTYTSLKPIATISVVFFVVFCVTLVFAICVLCYVLQNMGRTS